MDRVSDSAPYLLFSCFEKHMPGRPETFRTHSRFRQSNYRGNTDRGWNVATGRWEDGNPKRPEYFGAEWPTICGEIQRETGWRRAYPLQPEGAITRPRDERNLWKEEDSTRGFFLELEEGMGRDRSGTSHDRPVEIFHDLQRFQINNRRWIGLSYWFFYIFNWNVAMAHEGDWEHITLYFDADEYEGNGRPEFIFFAAHNHGHLLRAKDKKITWEEETHPWVYVSPWGHPSYPTMAALRRRDFTTTWRTWDRPIPHIPDQAWHSYDGAWGEVGESVHSTGPLGPFFKRQTDRIRLRSGLK